jgi:CPA2 family monovalent cation:H+ antiporter-2
LLVPLLAGDEQVRQAWAYLLLAVNSILFVTAVLVIRKAIGSWVVPMLGRLRSIELATLFTLIVLVGFCLGAVEAGLPPALGAFAAGLALSGNRMTGQLDALILPYRESFGAVFFVSLGTLLDPEILIQEPLLLAATLLAVLVVKTAAAAVALWAGGLRWPAALGMGLGLAQLGELSFMILSEGMHANLVSAAAYNRMLFLAVGTLILTPPLLKIGLRLAQHPEPDDRTRGSRRGHLEPTPAEALVIGLGPIGRQAASRLEIMGIDVCLIDLSPVNLYFYTQQGFRAVAGDARQTDVLGRAHADHARLAVICVPDDTVAREIVQTLRSLNPTCISIVRCRYEAHAPILKQAGATTVVSEEAEASAALLRLLECTTPE